MGWLIALLGLAAVIAGGGAIATGWPMMPLERGWALTIAGAALASGGLVCLGLAAQIAETKRIRLALERGLARLAEEPGLGASAAPAARAAAPRDMTQDVTAIPPRPLPQSITVEPAPRPEPPPADEPQPARSFTVGDTTFVVFADGSIEARTAQGTRRFSSMDEVRAYLEASVS